MKRALILLAACSSPPPRSTATDAALGHDAPAVTPDARADAPPDAPAFCADPTQFGFDARDPGVVLPNPYALAVVDANHDGFDDVVVADGTGIGGSAGVLLGTGTGTLHDRIEVAGSAGARGVAATDLDGNGMRDDVMLMLAPTAMLGPRVSNGTGTFSGGMVPLAVAQPDQLVMADLDGDGLDDALVLHRDAGTLELFRQLADHSFAAQPALAIAPGAHAVAAGRIDADALVDLVVTYGTDDYMPGQLVVYPGSAAFQFGAPTTLAVGALPIDVTIGRLQTTGGPTIVSVAAFGGNSAAYAWHHDGTEFVARPNLVTGASPRAVIIADIDGDGANDVVTANYESNSVSVLINQGDGTFGFHHAFGAYGLGAIDVAAGDFNHDGRTDLAVLNLIDSTVVILVNRCL